jgi:hypothetical protein
MVVRGIIGPEAATHLIPDEGGVPGETILELLHDDLCDPIRPVTPRGNRYLLIMDDLIWYMLVAAIPSKDHVAAAIKEIQAWVEGESDLK